MATFITQSFKWSGSSTSTINGTSGVDNLVGTAANETIYANGGYDTLTGGAGDDRYYIGGGAKVVESADGGIDTVTATTNYTLPDNVENLEVWGAYGAIGNSLSNIIKGNAQTNTINGMGGNDLLTGAGGSDYFVFDKGSGYDVISDFTAGSGSGFDMIRLGGYSQFQSLANVTAAMTQDGADVILTLSPTDAIKIQNTTVSQFTDSNFQFAFDPSKLKMTFDDEFDSLSLWNPTTKTGTWRTDYGYGSTTNSLGSRTLTSNNEQQIYTDPNFKGTSTSSLGLNPFSINNGVATITAAPAPADVKQYMYNYDYTSGLLTTKPTFSQTYGYFEARIDLPEGTGAWPAFWLLPADGSWPPELDVMEAYGSALTYQTVHSNATGSHTMEYTTNYVNGGTDGFHTYGVLWTKDTITWYIDGAAVDTAATPTDMNKPMYMLLNLAVQDSASPTFTADMKIDYVRAYSLDAAPVTSGSTTTTTPTPTPTPTPEPTPTTSSSSGSTTTTSGSASTTTTTSTTITGTSGNDTLNGTDAADRIEGGAGNDTLYGKGGNDTMLGGLGDDTYYVTETGDIVTEKAGEGYDVIRSSVDFTLPDNVEDLILIGNALRGTGNSANNWVIGNALNNVLSGGAGDDGLSGWDGDDILNGGAGNDRLSGGNGKDTFVFQAGFGKDTITDFQLGTDKIDWSAFSGKAPVITSVNGSAVLTWGTDSVTLTGISATDPALKAMFATTTTTTTTTTTPTPTTTPTTTTTTTTSTAGKTFTGTMQNDVYTVTSSNDVIKEPTSGGTDLIKASVDYVMAANVENMILTGSAVKGVGNTMNNIIEGNDLANRLEGLNGDDRLDGKAGADTLLGGQGSDTFIVDNVGDVVIEKANEGWDKVQASVSFTLSENVEDLILTGTAAKGVGNWQANVITGNDAANTLLGAGGNDTLIGNGGNDILNGGTGNDKLTGGAGIDTFVFEKGFGQDVITDFQLGTDKLGLAALGGVNPTISSSNGGAVLSWGADTITLVGVSANDPMLKAMFVA